MGYCLLVGGGLVFNILGPFRSKEAARQWATSSQITQYLICPIIQPAEVYDILTEEKVSHGHHA